MLVLLEKMSSSQGFFFFNGWRTKTSELENDLNEVRDDAHSNKRIVEVWNAFIRCHKSPPTNGAVTERQMFDSQTDDLKAVKKHSTSRLFKEGREEKNVATRETNWIRHVVGKIDSELVLFGFCCKDVYLLFCYCVASFL